MAADQAPIDPCLSGGSPLRNGMPLPDDEAVTIGSLNLHCGISGAGRPFDVPAALAQLAGDIIAVQEVWWAGTDDHGAGPGPNAGDGTGAHGTGTDHGAPADGTGTDDGAGADGTGTDDGAGTGHGAGAGHGAGRERTGAGHGAGAGRTGAGRTGDGRTGTGRAGDGAGAGCGSDTDGVAVAARALRARLIRTTVRAGVTLAELSIVPQPDRGNWGIAVLSRLPVTSYEAVDLGQAPGDVARRAALICSVTTPAGWPLRVVNAHLTHRLTSPAQLYRLARHLARTPMPTVIVGDLNMPRLATWVAAGYAPTVRGATFPAHRPVIQLDHLLASPDLACSAATVLPPVGSDHLPVLARFRRAPGVHGPARG